MLFVEVFEVVELKVEELTGSCAVSEKLGRIGMDQLPSNGLASFSLIHSRNALLISRHISSFLRSRLSFIITMEFVLGEIFTALWLDAAAVRAKHLGGSLAVLTLFVFSLAGEI